MLSVCLSTYNGSAFITRQLDSIMEQLGTEDEVIVIDDCSTDETVSLIEARGDARITVYRNPENQGPSANFARALSYARGDYLFLADQDDIWLPQKVTTVMTTFAREHASVVVHDAIVVAGDLTEIAPSWNNYNHNNIQPTVCSTVWKNGFTGCMMAFKRELLPSFLPIPPTVEMHDQWFGLVALRQKVPVCFIPEPLMLYVRHGGNATAIHKRSLWTKIKGRVGTLRALGQSTKN